MVLLPSKQQSQEKVYLSCYLTKLVKEFLFFSIFTFPQCHYSTIHLEVFQYHVQLLFYSVFGVIVC